jgi:hypothetical protein
MLVGSWQEANEKKLYTAHIGPNFDPISHIYIDSFINIKFHLLDNGFKLECYHNGKVYRINFDCLTEQVVITHTVMKSQWSLVEFLYRSLRYQFYVGACVNRILSQKFFDPATNEREALIFEMQLINYSEWLICYGLHVGDLDDPRNYSRKLYELISKFSRNIHSQGTSSFVFWRERRELNIALIFRDSLSSDSRKAIENINDLDHNNLIRNNDRTNDLLLLEAMTKAVSKNIVIFAEYIRMLPKYLFKVNAEVTALINSVFSRIVYRQVELFLSAGQNPNQTFRTNLKNVTPSFSPFDSDDTAGFSSLCRLANKIPKGWNLMAEEKPMAMRALRLDETAIDHTVTIDPRLQAMVSRSYVESFTTRILFDVKVESIRIFQNIIAPMRAVNPITNINEMLTEFHSLSSIKVSPLLLASLMHAPKLTLLLLFYQANVRQENTIGIKESFVQSVKRRRDDTSWSMVDSYVRYNSVKAFQFFARVAPILPATKENKVISRFSLIAKSDKSITYDLETTIEPLRDLDPARKEIMRGYFHQIFEPAYNCNVLLVSQSPQTVAFDAVPFKANAAYIFCITESQSKQLFYTNKAKKECVQLEVSDHNIDNLILSLQPSTESRLLNGQECRLIEESTAEKHNHKKITQRDVDAAFEQATKAEENKFIEIIYELTAQGKEMVGGRIFQIIMPHEQQRSIIDYAIFGYLDKKFNGNGIMIYLTFRLSFCLYAKNPEQKLTTAETEFGSKSPKVAVYYSIASIGSFNMISKLKYCPKFGTAALRTLLKSTHARVEPGEKLLLHGITAVTDSTITIHAVDTKTSRPDIPALFLHKLHRGSLAQGETPMLLPVGNELFDHLSSVTQHWQTTTNHHFNFKEHNFELTKSLKELFQDYFLLRGSDKYCSQLVNTDWLFFGNAPQYSDVDLCPNETATFKTSLTRSSI